MSATCVIKCNMERSVLEDVKNHKFCTHISKSSGSLVKIDSISIDLANANQKIEMGNCNHFSIRGYVAEIRKKDEKICWPFSNDDKCSKTEEHISTLPPLQAAKFRLWHCENCRRDIDSQGTPKDIKTYPNCSKSGVQSNTSANLDTNANAGYVISSKNGESHEFSEPSSVTKKIDPCLELEIRTSDKVALMLKCNGFMETWKPDCGVNEATVNKPNITKLECLMKKDDKHKKLSTVSGKSRVLGIVNESGFAAAYGQVSAPASSQDSDTSDCGSSESDEIPVACNSLEQHQEGSSFSHPQKPRKVRLLAELLDASRNAKADAPSISQNQRDMVGKIGKKFMDKTRKKKKMAHEGNCILPETSSPNSENKKSRISLGESKSDNNKVHKNHLSNNKIVKNSDEDDDRRHILNKKLKGVGIANIASTPPISTGRVMDPVLRNLFPLQESPRKSSLCKKKTSMPHVENLQAFLMPWNNNLLRKNSSTRQNAETMQTRPEVQASSSPYENFLAAQQNKRNLMPLIEHQQDFVLPKGQCILGENQAKRKHVGGKYIGESSAPCKPAVHAFNDDVLQRDLSIKTGPGLKSLVSEKQNCPSRAEDEELSAQQKMGTFGKRNGEKGIKVKKHHTQTVNKLFEQRATDDIPMEIIELLAKNQFEKHLQNAETNSSLCETTYRPRNGESIKLNNIHANGDIKLRQQENPHLGKSRPDNPEKNMFATQETVKYTNQRPVSNFPPLNLPDGSYISQGLHAFSRGMQSSAPSSSIHLGALPGDWSSTLLNHVPYKDQTGTLQKEKVNGNPVPKPFDLNVASYEKQIPNFASQNINRVDGEHHYGCNNGIEFFPNQLGPKALYSNETIPAMHLLSLMDPGMRSITPFLPHENQKVLTRTPFLQDRHHISSVDYRKNPNSEKSCECTFTLSLQNDTSTLKSREKGKAKRPYTPKRSKSAKSHEYVYTNREMHTNFDFSHSKNTQRFLLPDSTKHVESNPQSSCEMVCPKKRGPKMEICSLSRNPADFTIPGIGNIYMIGAEDLKFGRKSSLTSVVIRDKKQRLANDSTTKEQAHNQIS